MHLPRISLRSIRATTLCIKTEKTSIVYLTQASAQQAQETLMGGRLYGIARKRICKNVNPVKEMRKQRGINLIELMVVLAVVAIMSSFAAPALRSFIQNRTSWLPH
jgi:prepilin-type N-terminal cleavage/methylation domain-containing protein